MLKLTIRNGMDIYVINTLAQIYFYRLIHWSSLLYFNDKLINIVGLSIRKKLPSMRLKYENFNKYALHK